MAVDAVAVALAGADAGEVAVPVEGVALLERDALLAVVAEEAELDALGVLAEEREVRPLAVPGRAEGERRARPDLPHRRGSTIPDIRTSTRPYTVASLPT
jgi:hypothetical protein